MKKIFIVGCPRSGTTLLQSLMASHSEIVSFPETHLFSKTIHINPVLRFFTIYNRSHLQKLNDIRREFNLSELSTLRIPILKTESWGKILLHSLDEIGEKFKSGGESVLLEKTPRHLHYVDLIQKIETDALFIHIVRNGEDVVASLMEATGENPGEWSGSRSVEKSVFWWNRSIKLSRKYIGKSGHLHVRYEDLIAETDKMLRKICEFSGLNFEDEMIKNFNKTAQNLISEGENWKSKNTASEMSKSSKFDELPEEIQQKIRSGLIDFDYSRISI